MSKEELTVNLSQEIDQSKQSLVEELERISKYTAIAEQVSQLSDEFRLPESSLAFVYGFKLHNSIPDTQQHEHKVAQDVLENFYEYSTRYAVIVMMTSCEMFLIRLLWLAQICNNIRKNNSLSLPREHFYQLGTSARKIARHTSVPKLVERIGRELGEEIHFENLPLFESIYAARNCLTHRSGRVSKEDVDKNGNLILRWKELYITINDMPQQTRRGVVIKAGETVGITPMITEKKFRVGEKLVLTAQDCQYIALTLAAFSEDMRLIMHHAARKVSHNDG